MLTIPTEALTREQVSAAVAQLRRVGGVYTFIADIVELREGVDVERRT